MCGIALSIFFSFLHVTKLIQMITNFAALVITNYNKIDIYLYFPAKSGTIGCNIKFRRKSWRNLKG
jgi:hypothetical protein